MSGFAIHYSKLSSNYSLKAPKGFREFTKKHGNAQPNTCAVRLAHALRLTSPRFFIGVEAPLEWKDLPTKASQLAVILNKRLGRARLIRRRSEIEGDDKKGIVFFDTITGFGGSGHISLWDGHQVEDGGDYFAHSPRVYFWQLP